MFFALILMLVPPNRLYLLLSTIADVVAFVLSGFLMGLLIAYFSKNREMSATSLGALIVIIFYSFCVYHSYLFYAEYSGNRVGFFGTRIFLGQIFGGVFLFASALLAAWLIVRKRGENMRLRQQMNLPHN